MTTTDVEFELAWEVVNSIGTYRVIHTEDIVNAVAEVLKDDPHVTNMHINKLLVGPSEKHALHYHMVNDVVQNHSWDECPENPKNQL